MKRLLGWLKFSSLYSRLSIALWIVVVVLMLTQGAIHFLLWKEANYEAGQRIGWDIAEEVSRQIQPLLIGAPVEQTKERVPEAVARFALINPRIDFFLLDERGNVLAAPYFPRSGRVDTGPIESFLTPVVSRKLPLLGQDPFAKEPKVFSAARVSLNGEPGYVYIILEGMRDQSLVRVTLDRYALIGSIAIAVIALLGAGGLGSFIFAVATRRYRQLVGAVHQLGEQNFEKRIAITGDDEIGQLASVINQMVDRITDIIGQLKETDRLRRELVASVFHDLNEPIASIHAYLDLLVLKGETFEPETHRQYLQSSLANAKRLSRLLQDLFELSKLEAKDKVPEPVTFNLLEIVDEELLPACKRLADAKQVELRIRADGVSPVVHADTAMVLRALSNLVENAIRYNREAGWVEVAFLPKAATATTPAGVTVEVRDSGPGIPAQDLPHLFVPFYRGSQQRNRGASAGSGLGLAIVRKLIEAHGSQIEVESELGKGTTFRFSLPAAGSMAE